MKKMLILLLMLIVCPGFAAEDEAPPVPAGYPFESAAMAAAKLGLLELIDAENVEIPESVEARLGIEYKNVDGRSLKLDLFKPKEIEGKAPGIVFIHGGSWKGGDREQLKFYAVHFAKRGYVTISIEYRLSKEASFPAAVEDSICALQWLRANADEYSVDPERIAVSGNSAGGHLSLMVGYASDKDELNGQCGLNESSSLPRAVINFYGPVDLTGEDAVDNGAVIDFMGGRLEDNEDAYRLASPLFHVDSECPPTLTFHGTIDSVVNVSHADRLIKALEEAGVEYVYEKYKGWGHVMDVAVPVNKRCLYMMERFLEKHLKD